MNKLVGALAAVSLAWFVQAPAMAERTKGPPIPNLMGTWSGTFKAQRWEGTVDVNIVIRVITQDGVLFKAEKTWEHASEGPKGDSGGELTTKASEKLVGVFGFDGYSITMAEQGDDGVYQGRLSHPDAMELIYFEPGEVATVNQVVLTRTK